MSIISFKLRIGAKLAISAGVGVLLVGIMLVSQKMGAASVEHSSEQALAQRTLSQIATDMKASVRGMMVGVRDLRLAQTPEDIQKAEAYLHARGDSVVRFLNAALKLVHLPENRERIEKAKSLAATYRAVGKDVAVAKGELFALAGKRQQNGDNWRKHYGAATKALESSKAGEISAALREAAAMFDEARTAGWRYAATGEAAQLTRTTASTDNALARLGKLRGRRQDDQRHS
jgi:hypothetical protein